MAKDLNVTLIEDQTIHILRKFMIFADLTEDEIRRFLSMGARYQNKIAKICSYKSGETVIREGDFDCWSFWVIQGCFEVVQDGEVVIRFSKPGEIFGEMSVLEGIPRTASVTAVTKGACLCIDMSVIDHLEDPHIAETIRSGFYKVSLARLNRTKDKMMAERHRLDIKYADLLDFERRIQKKTDKK